MEDALLLSYFWCVQLIAAPQFWVVLAVDAGLYYGRVAEKIRVVHTPKKGKSQNFLKKKR